MMGSFFNDEILEEQAYDTAQSYIFTLGGKSNALLNDFKLRNTNDNNMNDIPMYVI